MLVSCTTNAALATQMLVFVVAIHLVVVKGADTFCTPENLGRFGNWPKELDASIYWFGPNDQAEKATSGSASQFYDPTKPTMLYFHGWTGAGLGWTSICKRITTRCHPDMCPDGGGQLLVNDWLRAGWNVGLFYWDQFADEECARDAEQKLWFDRKGDGFRWKSYDVGSGVSTYENFADLNVLSVSDMCADAVKMAMGSFTGPQVRFVGHSLGAQLATRCAALLHVENHRAAPQRLALLEPYFSRHSHLMFFGCSAKVTTSKGMDDFAAESTVAYVKNLWESKKVVTEIYKSSILTEKSSSGTSVYEELHEMVQDGAGSALEDTLVGNLGGGMRDEVLERAATTVKYEPDWCLGVQSDTSGDVQHLGCRHCAVMPMYLLSFGRAAPPLHPTPRLNAAQKGSALSSCMTPAASCTDGQVREWVERQLTLQQDQSWSQLGGRDSFDEIDDSFAINPTLEETVQLGLTVANDIVELKAVELPPANQVPLLVQILTSPWFLIPVAAACVAACVVSIVAIANRGDGGEDSDEEGFSTSRPFKETAPNGYEGLIAADGSEHSINNSFMAAGSGTAVMPAGFARPGYGQQP